MQWALVALMVLHGLIHFMGPAKAFGLADLPQLTQPISRGLGVVWAVAGVMMMFAAGHFLVAPRTWWVTAFLAVGLSQFVIALAWSDARVGTVANFVVLAVALDGFLTYGPLGLRAQYERDVQSVVEAAEGAEVAGPDVGGSLPTALTPDDLFGLPEAVRRYVTASGAVGRPRPQYFQARWTGRIRGGPDQEWMEFVAEQHNGLDAPARFFYMDARRGGLPVAIYHDMRGGRARMRVRLLSMIPLVHETGPEMDRAETVALFNDIALLAPGGLVDADTEWEVVDGERVLGRFTQGSNIVEAVLHFGEGGMLTDFVSDDRYAADPGADGGFVRMRWSTPVTEWRTFDGLRVMSRGQGVWHPEGAPSWTYVEMTLTDLVWR